MRQQAGRRAAGVALLALALAAGTATVAEPAAGADPEPVGPVRPAVARVPIPAPPAPDPAALARLPVAPDAVPGARAVGPCPTGVPPTGLDALGTSGGEPGAPDPPLAGAGTGVTVAVVDTGVAPHPRLAGRLADGGDFVAGGSDLEDCDGHGTAVAGILAAAPAPDDLVVGLVPAARVLAVRQTSTWVRPPGTVAAGDLDTLARAVRAATRPGVGVMTLALAACVAPARVADPVVGPALGALRAAVRGAVDAGVVVVAAAGTTGDPGGCAAPDATGDAASLPVPAWFGDDVVTVGAAVGGRADPASLPGPWVDLAADGRVAVALDARGPDLTVALSTPGAGPAPLVGSSFAAARVAGVAAALRAREPGLGPRDVAARLVRAARPPTAGPDPALGAGLLDARAVLEPPTPDPATANSAGPRAPTDPATSAAGWWAAGLGVVAVGIVAAVLAGRARIRRGARR